MTKKKPENEDSNLQLKTRQPGKVNKNYFGDFKSRFEENLHPLDEMFPQPISDEKTGKKTSEFSENELQNEPDNSGHPAGESLGAYAPRNDLNAPSTKNVLGAYAPRKNESGHPKNENWRKYEKTRSTIRVNLQIDKEIDRKVRQFCKIDAHPKTDLRQFYERAAVMLLDFLDTQTPQSLGAYAPYDDRRLMRTYKCNVSIINLYLAYNFFFNQKTKWTMKDDEAGLRFNNVDIRIVELGIIQTHFNRGFRPGKINSFQYYINQIEEMTTLEFGEETLEAMLKINRTRWQQSAGKQLDLKFLDRTEEEKRS